MKRTGGRGFGVMACGIAAAGADSFSPLAIRAFTPVFDGLWRRLG
jgi:hypothetical protein